jgi:hypothetical protein
MLVVVLAVIRIGGFALNNSTMIALAAPASSPAPSFTSGFP